MDKLPGLVTMPLGRHKVIEFQRIKEGEKGPKSLGFTVSLSFKQDHAGFYVALALWNIRLVIHLYDGRHWCREHGRWIDEGHPQHED